MSRVGRGALKDHVRDIQRVKGLWCRGAGVLLGGYAVALALDQRKRLEHHLWNICSKAVLHLPFQLHPPVLKPRSDLQRGETCEYGNTGRIYPCVSTDGLLRTWVSVRLSFCAVFNLSPASRYLCLAKIFSSLPICSVVNLVRTRRCCDSFSVSSTERHSEEVASLSYPEEYPLLSETNKKIGKDG